MRNFWPPLKKLGTPQQPCESSFNLVIPSIRMDRAVSEGLSSIAECELLSTRRPFRLVFSLWAFVPAKLDAVEYKGIKRIVFLARCFRQDRWIKRFRSIQNYVLKNGNLHPRNDALIAQIVRFARPNIQIYDANVVDLYQWVLCAIFRWCEGCRYKSKARFEFGTRPNFRTDHVDFQPKGPPGGQQSNIKFIRYVS